jgi:putative tricarboxylic transport membrane protein
LDILQNIGLGFSVALQPQNLLYCFLGVLAGTLVGVLPGIGPVTGIALLIPITFGMNPTSAIIMLAGIYYGAMYGGSTTSILIKTPGESASVMTSIDGYELAKQGRAGAALGMSAVSSFVGGTLSVLGLMLIAPLMVRLALKFGPPEYCALMLFGLTLVTRLAGDSMAKALQMALLGLIIGTVGIDPIGGQQRLTFGRPELLDGLDFVAVAMGLFALAEVLNNMDGTLNQAVIKAKLRNLWPSRQDFAESRGAIGRGSLLGFLVGSLPGAGATLASFMAYAVEKKFSKRPERFGKGAIDAVAAAEGANNAATGGAMVPMLTLGIPSSATTAIMLGAMLLYGLQPGPQLIARDPRFFWGVVASMYIGNLMLVILNLPLVGLFASILCIPYRILLPLIVLFTALGAYAIANNVSDMWIMIAFGVLGYFLQKFNYPAAPVVLGLVLGPLVEIYFAQAMTISAGDYSIFLTRPGSAAILAALALAALAPLFGKARGWTHNVGEAARTAEV